MILYPPFNKSHFLFFSSLSHLDQIHCPLGDTLLGNHFSWSSPISSRNSMLPLFSPSWKEALEVPNVSDSLYPCTICSLEPGDKESKSYHHTTSRLVTPDTSRYAVLPSPQSPRHTSDGGSEKMGQEVPSIPWTCWDSTIKPFSST